MVKLNKIIDYNRFTHTELASNIFIPILFRCTRFDLSIDLISKPEPIWVVRAMGANLTRLSDTYMNLLVNSSNFKGQIVHDGVEIRTEKPHVCAHLHTGWKTIFVLRIKIRPSENSLLMVNVRWHSELKNPWPSSVNENSPKH